MSLFYCHNAGEGARNSSLGRRDLQGSTIKNKGNSHVADVLLSFKSQQEERKRDGKNRAVSRQRLDSREFDKELPGPLVKKCEKGVISQMNDDRGCSKERKVQHRRPGDLWGVYASKGIWGRAKRGTRVAFGASYQKNTIATEWENTWQEGNHRRRAEGTEGGRNIGLFELLSQP